MLGSGCLVLRMAKIVIAILKYDLLEAISKLWVTWQLQASTGAFGARDEISNSLGTTRNSTLQTERKRNFGVSKNITPRLPLNFV